MRDEVIGKGSSAEVYKVVTASGVTLAVKRCVCATLILTISQVDVSLLWLLN